MRTGTVLSPRCDFVFGNIYVLYRSYAMELNSYRV
jgi:hypothetical protein